MIQDATAYFLDQLPRKSECIFLSDSPAEKLSGGFYDQNFIPARFAKKFDEYFAVSYILQGGGKYTDYLGQTFPVTPGSLLIRHAGTRHSTHNQYDERHLWLEFAAALPASFYQAIRSAGLLEQNLTLIQAGVDRNLIENGAEYIDSLANADTGCGRCHSYELFLKFLTLALQKHEELSHPDSSQDRQLIRRAKALLSANFEKQYSMEEIAHELGIGYENFRKKFAQSCGLSPNEYRIRKRLDKADSLLLHTPLSIKEIAEILGYSAISSFTRQYQAFRHTPPRAIRKKNSEETARQ